MKSKKKKPFQIPTFKIIVYAVLVLQSIAIIVLSFFVYLEKQELKSVSAMPITRLIAEAVRGLSNPVNIDAQSGKVYVHEARLVLPAASDQSLKLLYNYSPTNDASTEEVHLINQSIFNSQIAQLYSKQAVLDALNAVPKLQSCARGYLLKFDNQAVEGVEKKFQKQLSDGRSVFVYSEKLCSENSDAMTEYLKQINSY